MFLSGLNTASTFPSEDEERVIAIELKEGTIVWLKVWRVGWWNCIWGPFESFGWTWEIKRGISCFFRNVQNMEPKEFPTAFYPRKEKIEASFEPACRLCHVNWNTVIRYLIGTKLIRLRATAQSDNQKCQVLTSLTENKVDLWEILAKWRWRLGDWKLTALAIGRVKVGRTFREQGTMGEMKDSILFGARCHDFWPTQRERKQEGGSGGPPSDLGPSFNVRDLLIRNISRKHIASSKEWEEGWRRRHMRSSGARKISKNFHTWRTIPKHKACSVSGILVNLTLIGIFNNTWVRRSRLADNLAEEKRKLLGSLHKITSSSWVPSVALRRALSRFARFVTVGFQTWDFSAVSISDLEASKAKTG